MGVFKRQNVQYIEDDRDYYFWHTTEGEAIRWSIFGAIVLFFVLWMGVGYWHAQRRIAQGLPPLSYHRWLLSRRQRAAHDPSYRPQMPYYSNYQPAQEYGMHNYPPPVYDHNSAPPPTYQPPPGATKLDPNQQTFGTTRSDNDDSPAYTAPSGPPPVHLAAQRAAEGESSNSNRL